MPATKEISRDSHATRLAETQRQPIPGAVLSDAVLSELKRHAPAGCLLCFLDAWDEEEWY